MTETEWIQDVVCFAVPRHIDPQTVVDADGKPSAEMIEVIQYTILRQYERPPRALVIDVQLMVTDQVDDIEQFQPAHDCAACLAGNDQARAFMQEHPGQHLVLGNLRYQEIWR